MTQKLLNMEDVELVLNFKTKSDKHIITEEDAKEFFKFYVRKNEEVFDMLTEAYSLFINKDVPDNIEQMKSDILDFEFEHKNKSDKQDIEHAIEIVTDHNWLMLCRNMIIPKEWDEGRPAVQVLGNTIE